MNDKEIGELRRRMRRDRSNMTAIYGCFVNGQKEIVSEFKQSTGIMPENEADKYFGLLRRSLSGSLGRNLIDITFKTSQVADSPEHKMLMELRNTGLQNDELRMEFYQKVIQSVFNRFILFIRKNRAFVSAWLFRLAVYLFILFYYRWVV